ncbi:MAG: DUF4395 domain-containing protein [Candidatus Dormibacteraeota bacterium]|nr:DUF4395 domain-containing protein [Candidatus Dormibacteraeota bacterium]
MSGTAGEGIVDRTALKVNQAGIIATLLVAFLLSALTPVVIWLVPVLALVMLLGTWQPRLGLFRQLYFALLKPAGVLRPSPRRESPRPHAFAQLLGGVMLVLASLVFAASATLLGWVLAWVVIILAFANLAFDF